MSVHRRAVHEQAVPGYRGAPVQHSYGPPAPLPPLPYYSPAPTSSGFPPHQGYSQYSGQHPGLQPPYQLAKSFSGPQWNQTSQQQQQQWLPNNQPQQQWTPTSQQQQAAASFFAKSRGSGQQSSIRLQPLDRQPSEEEEDAVSGLTTNFRAVLSKAPPPLPPGLLRRLEGGEAGGVGKVRVILRVAAPNGPQDEEKTRFLGLDKKKRQVTLLDPTVSRGEIAIEDRKVGVAAPKMFAFDGVFTSEDSQEEVSAAALTDIIAAVINGNDGCLFCFGHASLGKTYTMIGTDRSARTVGVLPTAIAWLYRAIKERKQRTGARFSVRVSAVEICPGSEQMRDLLAKYASESDQSPGVYLRHLPTSSQGYALQNLSEVRASSLDKAAHYLDAALTERSQDEAGRGAHLLYTLYVYQYSVDKSGKGGVVGGRSRLHLIDFGGCERTRQQGGGITLSSLGNVILGIFNGQKHLPCRESKVTQVLRECLGSLTCHAAMLAHVSPEPAHYSETLHTVQLASRVHRMRRKRMKAESRSGGSTSSDEHRRMSKLRSHDSSGKSGSSDFTSTTDPSSSEMSCDTVVFRGHSDGSGTDGEGVPLAMPRLGRHVLLGSAESLQSRGSRSSRRSGSKILTNGAISPAGRSNLSPVPRSSPRSPRLGSLPAIQETVQGGKMPLTGRVPGHRQEVRPTTGPKEVWVDGMPGPCAPHVAPQAVPGVARQYGYMDEFKANMISHWVENQSTREEGEPLYLTQFKQADSDSGSEHRNSSNTKVQVHSTVDLAKLDVPLETHLDNFPESPEVSPKISDTAEAHLEALEAALVSPTECPDYYSELLESEVRRTRQAPLPPPRTTPPREVREVEGTDSPEPLKEPGSLEDIFLQCQRLVNTLSNTDGSVDEPSKPKTQEPKIQGSENFDPTNPMRHPLRILSEENLTIVSTFVADVNDLESMEDEEEECDPSKFSFFEVPEFTSRSECPDADYFESRLRELSRLACPEKEVVETQKKQEVQEPPINKLFADPRFLQSGSYQTLSTFSQAERSPVSDCPMDRTPESHSDGQDIMDRSPADCAMDSPSPLPSPGEPLTPQKQFLLLSHSLRHPDGSSNPDLSQTKRSPGNGQSSSDQEEEARLIMAQDSDLVNGNQKCSTPSEQNSCENKPKKKESSNIAARLLRLFGSTRRKNLNKIDERRSKSCDRELEEPLPRYKEVLQKDFRSASSSPLKRTDRNKKEKGKTNKENKAADKAARKARSKEELGRTTPSTLSLAPTEWEYQGQEDEMNGNPRLCSYYGPEPSRQSFLVELGVVRQGTRDRKSSGYDSLEGESSSLDSEHLNNELNLKSGTLQYSVPSDQQDSGLHYDTVSRLKMDIKRHPNILRPDY